MDLREISWVGGRGVNGTGSELCPVVGFGISGVDTSGSATRDVESYLNVEYR